MEGKGGWSSRWRGCEREMWLREAREGGWGRGEIDRGREGSCREGGELGGE